MSSGITCTIKMKPYLKEFVICRYLKGSYISNADDAIGSTIKPFLVASPPGLIRINANTNDSYFTFELPNYTDKKVNIYNYIQPENQRYIEKIFEMLFRESMFHFVLQNLELNKGDIKDWIICWCRMNNVTFAKVNYDTLKKAFWRYRKDQIEKKKNENITTRLLPCVSPKYHFVVPQLSRKNEEELNDNLELINTEDNEF